MTKGCAMKIIYAFALFFSLLANDALSQVCLEHGGTSACSKPAVGPWNYAKCDIEDLRWNHNGIWCGVLGGECAGYKCERCPGAKPLSNEIISSVTASYLGSSISSLSDSGWGATIPDRDSCYPNSSPRYDSGVMVDDYRYLVGQNNLMVEWRRSRKMFCPAGMEFAYGLINGENSTYCIQPMESNICDKGESSFVGNPISALNGVKVADELDISLPFGLDYKRFYRSAGSYVPLTKRAEPDNRFGVHWRGSYGDRLWVAQDLSAVSAAYSSEEGIVQYFDANGNGVLSNKYKNSKIKITSDGVLFFDGDLTKKFNLKGDLISVFDTSGQVKNLAYSEGLVSKISDGWGRYLSFYYSSEGVVNKIGVMGGEGFFLSTPMVGHLFQ